MLKNLSKTYRFKDLDIDITNKFIGRSIKIIKDAKYCVDDSVLDSYLKINKISFQTLDSKASKIIKCLNLDPSHDSFYDLIPSKFYKENKNQIYQLLKDETVSDYFLNIIRKRYELTSMIVDANYDHISTSTGRMKITSGVNFLTMKKNQRSSIPVDKNNKLVEIDIKSCEPALLHAILYDETPEDIYSFFGNDIPRNKIKIAVISSLYGSSPSRVKKISGMSTKDIMNIHDHFKLKKIKEEILDTFNKKGCFYNLYGRPLYDISSPVNYWLQSSAADYSCLAFLNLVNKENLKVKACIHDAIIIETSEKKTYKSVFDPISNISLKVEHSIVN